jgi:hypothetical protein
MECPHVETEENLSTFFVTMLLALLVIRAMQSVTLAQDSEEKSQETVKKNKIIKILEMVARSPIFVSSYEENWPLPTRYSKD